MLVGLADGSVRMVSSSVGRNDLDLCLLPQRQWGAWLRLVIGPGSGNAFRETSRVPPGESLLAWMPDTLVVSLRRPGEELTWGHNTSSGAIMQGIQIVWRARSAAAVVAALIVAVLLGCSGSTKTAVSGTVSYKNAPVTGGSITLTPRAAGASTYSIFIKADGTFLTNEIPPGQYQVAVSTDNVAAAVAPPGVKDYPLPGGGDTPKKVTIPDNFKSAATSGITWNVQSGSQTLPIDLGQ